MGVLYFAEDGSDTATGKESAPLATATKLLAKIVDGSFGQGDLALFKRGGEFFEKLTLPSGLATVTSGERLAIASYGHGPKPIISSYKTLNTGASWTEVDDDIWRIDLTDVSKFGGYQGITPSVGDQQPDGTDIGHLLVDRVLKGGRKASAVSEAAALALLDAGIQWDFYSDNAKYLYVKSSANPTTLCNDLRAATDGACVLGQGGLDLSGFRLEGSASHGITGNIKYSRFVDIEIVNIGGGRLDGQGDGTLRYGNCVNLTPGSADVLFDRIKAMNAYDAGFSPQGPLSSGRLGWQRVHARRFLFWGCSQNWEHWSSGTPEAGSGLVDCTFRDSFFGDTNGPWVQGGWRHGGLAAARHILIKPDMTLGADGSDITRNLMWGGVEGGSYHAAAVAIPEGLRIDENLGVFPAGMSLSGDTGEAVGATGKTPATPAEVTAWLAAIDTEQNSDFMLIPDDETDDLEAKLQRITGRVAGVEARARALEDGASDLAGFVEQQAVELRHADRHANVYRTLASSGGNQFARLCRLRMNGQNDKSSIVLLVSEADTSGLTNMGVALLHFKIYAGSSNNVRANVAITEIFPFDRASSGKFKASNFTPVLRASDNAYKHEIELWFSLSNPFQGLQFTPLIERSDMERVTLYSEEALSGSVPADYSTGSPTIVKTVIPRSAVPTALDVTYAASITPTCTDAESFNIGTLTGNVTIDNPTGTPFDGQRMRFRFTQDGTGRTVSWGANFAFGTDHPSANVPTSAGAKFEVEFRWHTGDGKWRCTSIVRGF